MQTKQTDLSHRAIVTVVMKFTECPPLATALHHLLNDHAISHLSYLVQSIIHV